MPAFGAQSRAILNTCDVRLRSVCDIVVVEYDIAILPLGGHRGRAEQERLFAEGKTKVQWPDSMHNFEPSMAVDCAPYPIDWDDARRFIYMAGLMLGTARSLGLKLRWGGNWDQDQVIIDDQNFNDLPHFEIVGI